MTRTLTLGRMSGMIVGLAAVGAITVSATLLVRPVHAGNDNKVTICHRTDSQTNPYVRITVDEASVDGVTGNDNGRGDHLAEHTGAVWAGPTTPKEPKWGDIIPPFYADGTPDGHPSLNWNAAGMAIFANDCKPAQSTLSRATPTPTPTPTPTANAQQVLGGTGTPGQTISDTAASLNGTSPIPAIGFGLILLASLATLAHANVKRARS